ncbi:hypothetical protein FO519_008579 [Halicephalobus sp. NKZ332]|nr:hypothetical protein FO519_008579 [Halicephalobus sp. NKZ332]
MTVNTYSVPISRWQQRYTFTGRFSTKVPYQQAAFLLALDAGIYMGLIIFIYVILTKVVLQPVQRGFYCNDPDIKSPLYPNSIPTPYLLLVTVGLPFFVVLGGIFLKNSGGTLNFTKKTLSKIFQETCFIYLDYVVGFGICTISLEFIKCGTGRLRPNFLSLCRPDLDPCGIDEGAYVENYVCNPLLGKYDRNSKMSFPSGHAAAAVFAQAFVQDLGPLALCF